MGGVLSVLILFAGLALIIGLIAADASFLDGREKGQSIRKKRVRELETTLQEIEQYARDALIVNVVDPTASHILGICHNRRRKELS